jgi:hypothetical protein
MARVEQADLASKAGVSVETVKRLERTVGPVSANVATTEAIMRVLESAGVEFIGDEQPGVRQRRFRLGDLVRFRPQTTARAGTNIGADDVGTVIKVEAGQAYGIGYPMSVQFGDVVRHCFHYEFELVSPTGIVFTDEDAMGIPRRNWKWFIETYQPGGTRPETVRYFADFKSTIARLSELRPSLNSGDIIRVHVPSSATDSERDAIKAMGAVANF